MTYMIRGLLIAFIVGALVAFLVRRDRFSMALVKAVGSGILVAGLVVGVMALVERGARQQREELKEQRLAARTVREMTVNLFVPDVNETIAFWRTHLGFQVVSTVPKTGEFQWALLTSGEAKLMLQRLDTILEERPVLAAQTPPGPMLLYLDVDDVSALRRALQDAGFEPGPLQNTFYNTLECTMLTPNGFQLVLAEDLAGSEMETKPGEMK